jgi:hypothetical protein
MRIHDGLALQKKAADRNAISTPKPERRWRRNRIKPNRTCPPRSRPQRAGRTRAFGDWMAERPWTKNIDTGTRGVLLWAPQRFGRGNRRHHRRNRAARQVREPQERDGQEAGRTQGRRENKNGEGGVSDGQHDHQRERNSARLDRTGGGACYSNQTPPAALTPPQAPPRGKAVRNPHRDQCRGVRGDCPNASAR